MLGWVNGLQAAINPDEPMSESDSEFLLKWKEHDQGSKAVRVCQKTRNGYTREMMAACISALASSWELNYEELPPSFCSFVAISACNQAEAKSEEIGLSILHQWLVVGSSAYVSVWLDYNKTSAASQQIIYCRLITCHWSNCTCGPLAKCFQKAYTLSQSAIFGQEL